MLADRAIFLDFEGKAPSRKSGESFPPTLAGWRCEGEYQLVVFEQRFACAAERKGGRVIDRNEFMTSLLERAKSEDRKIVYLTTKEAEEFGALGHDLNELGFDLAVPMRKVMRHVFQDYRAAKKERKNATSKSARKQARKRTHGLCVRCAVEIGLKVPSTYGWGKVGKWIQKAESMNERKYGSWTLGTKKAWGKLIAHNRLDCEAMEMLARHFAAQL